MRVFATSLFVIMWATISFGAHVNVTIQPAQVEAGETVYLTYTIRDAQKKPLLPALPTFPGFRQEGSPSTSESMEIRRGRRSSQNTITYKLTATEVGAYSLQPPPITVDSKQWKPAAIVVKVMQPPSLSDKVFGKLVAPNKTIYPYQPFNLELRIYIRDLRIGRRLDAFNMPSSGINASEFKQFRSTQEQVNGKMYNVIYVRAQVKALGAGKINFAPSFRMEREDKKGGQSQQRRRRSIFDDFLGRNTFKPFDLKPEPITVEISSFPSENKPDHFQGAVGRFTFNVNVNPPELQVGDPITIQTKIQGQGNIDSLSAPDWDPGSGFKTYQARLIDKRYDQAQQTGYRVFEQVIIPTTEDANKLPPFRFSYFDPTREKYETIEHGPIQLLLTAAPNSAHTAQNQMPIIQSSSGKQMLGEDLLYIKPWPGSTALRSLSFWYHRPKTLVFQLLPLLLVGVAYAYNRRRNRLQKDVAFARRSQAPRMARSALQLAKEAMNRNEPNDFYTHLWQSLSHYYSDRFNIGAGEISSACVATLLKQVNGSETLIASTEQLISQCNQARYGASATASDPTTMSKLYTQCQEVLKQCERLK